MLFPNKLSDELVVVFSSLTRRGIRARYNYVRTLQKVNKNKLFILDDTGPEHRGSYCLGKYGDPSVEQNTKSLIHTVKESNGIKHTYYCGSSKGSWCVLHFGLEDHNCDIIVGANQYYLGSYFLALPDIRFERRVLGDQWNKKDIDNLNNKLKDKLFECKDNKNRIHVHISNQEHTWEEHVKDMLEDLGMFEYLFDTEILHYKDRGEIVNYFPPYLKKMKGA